MQSSKPRSFGISIARRLIPTCHEYRGGNDWKTFHTRATKFINISPLEMQDRFRRDSPKIWNFNEFQPSSLELEREVSFEFFQIRRVQQIWREETILRGEELFDDPRSVDKITKRVEYDRSLVHQETISLAGNKRGTRRFFGRKMNFCCCLRRLDTETRRQLRATIRNILNHRPVN